MRTLVFTGGHHTSALEVAKALKARGWQIVWFGHRRSMWGDQSDSAEYREVTAAGIKFYGLKAGKLYRTFNPFKLLRLPLGFFQSLTLLSQYKPLGIVSFGGYLAVPVVIAGAALGIPVVTHEQTVASGWANRLISLFATKIALSWPQSRAFFPPNKVVLTGLPLRPQIVRIKGSKGSKAVVYITGGKQGAHVINETVFAALPRLVRKYKVIHQTGFNDYQRAKSYKLPNYEAFAYLSAAQVAWAYQKAAVVVGRAGAHTVYELAVLGKRCVLIPIAWASHNEQWANAQILAQNRQSIVLEQSKLNVSSLLSSVDRASRLSPQPLHLPLDGTKRLVQLIEASFP